MPRVGGEDLELVSLTYGAPPTPGSKPATLPMTGPAAAADTLHLRVVGKPSAFNYRMDAEFPPTGKFVWSTDVLVHDVGADLGQVGIFAFSRSSVGDILYRPVALSGDDPAYGAKPEDVIAELRPLVLVEHARWRFASQGGGATGWKTISSSEGLFIVRLAKQRMPGTLQVAWSEPGSGSVAFSLFPDRLLIRPGKGVVYFLVRIRQGGAKSLRSAVPDVAKPHWWLAIAGLVAAFLIIMSFVRWPWSFHVLGDVRAVSVTMTLDQPLDVAADLPLSTTPAGEIAGYSSLDGGLPTQSRPPVPLFPKDTDGMTVFSKLSMADKGRLTLRVRPVAAVPELTVMAAGSGASITVLHVAASGKDIRDGKDHLADPEVLTARYDAGSPEAMRLTTGLPVIEKSPGDEADRAERFAFEDVQVTDLHFSQPTTQKDGNAFVSSIRGGSVTILKTAEKHALSFAYPLMLKGFVGNVVHLSVGKRDIHVFFSGQADGLELGPPGYTQVLTPTCLEILLNLPGIKRGCALILAIATTVAPFVLRARQNISNAPVEQQQLIALGDDK